MKMPRVIRWIAFAGITLLLATISMFEFAPGMGAALAISRRLMSSGRADRNAYAKAVIGLDD